jgi:hypothetical protein
MDNKCPFAAGNSGHALFQSGLSGRFESHHAGVAAVHGVSKDARKRKRAYVPARPEIGA